MPPGEYDGYVTSKQKLCTLDARSTYCNCMTEMHTAGIWDPILDNPLPRPHLHNFSKVIFTCKIQKFTMHQCAPRMHENYTKVNKQVMKNTGTYWNISHCWFQTVPVFLRLAKCTWYNMNNNPTAGHPSQIQHVLQRWNTPFPHFRPFCVLGLRFKPYACLLCAATLVSDYVYVM